MDIGYAYALLGVGLCFLHLKKSYITGFCSSEY